MFIWENISFPGQDPEKVKQDLSKQGNVFYMNSCEFACSKLYEAVSELNRIPMPPEKYLGDLSRT